MKCNGSVRRSGAVPSHRPVGRGRGAPQAISWAIDPYNIAASKQLQRIDASRKCKYDEHARLETRDEMLRQVEETLVRATSPTNRTANVTAQARPGSQRDGHDQLHVSTKQLKNIFLSLDFNNATIEEATNFLSVESKRLDPNHKGVNFIIQPEASSTAKPVSITLNNVPLGEALRYVCQLANVKFKVQDYAISIVPFTASDRRLWSRRTFNVQPRLHLGSNHGRHRQRHRHLFLGSGLGRRWHPAVRFPPIPARPAPIDVHAGGHRAVQAALVAKGIKFPPGASAVYTSKQR